MKKSIYLAAIAAFALTSCSNDEVTNDVPDPGTGNAITFRTTMDKAPLGRANTTTGANIRKFKVVCYNDDNTHYFGPTDVTSSNGTSWTYNGVHNWKHKDKPLRFFAIHGTGNNAFREPTDVPAGGNIYPYVSNFEVHAGYFMNTNGEYCDSKGVKAEQLHPHHDLCAAFYEGKESDGPVALNFKHLLSKIEVQAKNNHHANGRTVEVIGVRLKNMASHGTWVYNIGDVPSATKNDQFDGTWTLHPSVDTNNFDGDFCIRLNYGATPVTLNETYQSILPKDESFMVFPHSYNEWTKTDQTGTYLSVICRVTTTDADGNTKVIVPNSGHATNYGMAMIPVPFNLEQGKKYTFKLDFTNGSGQVDPDVPEVPGRDDIEDPKDPDEGGDDYEGAAITFTVSVEDWVPALPDTNLTM